jgi:uncharacterized metal-binding protein YceD (DUF177 family)
LRSDLKELKKYTIQIVGLENQAYEYDMESGDAFFEEMEQNLIQRGHFKTHVVLDKSSTMIRLDFHIQGEVELICDRSLDPFYEPIDVEQRLFLKFGDRNEELTDEIELITWNTQEINVARYIFDFIGLSLPVKKLHPRFRPDELGDEDDEQEGKLIYSSSSPESDNEEEEKPDAPIDPRWEALRKLRDN